MSELESFMIELDELTKKYKLAITACGCCDGAFIYEIDTKLETPIFSFLQWDDNEKKYRRDG